MYCEYEWDDITVTYTANWDWTYWYVEWVREDDEDEDDEYEEKEILNCCNCWNNIDSSKWYWIWFSEKEKMWYNICSDCMKFGSGIEEKGFTNFKYNNN